jgi:hypothetical protein
MAVPSLLSVGIHTNQVHSIVRLPLVPTKITFQLVFSILYPFKSNVIVVFSIINILVNDTLFSNFTVFPLACAIASTNES